ncbi:trypsin-like peptidase domain-containing protein [Crenothrix polyspora]|nr:trypsin-like peptidase domain-containing protein [Crenothrix polyspora]
MQKIIIKHVTGSKSNQTDVFELPIEEIVFGRSSDCQVAFDAEKDAYVSTRHCKITVQNKNQFLLTDLNSSNGTFVNNVKITTPKQLQANDEVQLGKSDKDEGSVKFTFNLDPATPKTKLIGPKPTAILPSTPQTKVVQNTSASNGSLPTNSTMTSPESKKIGEKTAERLISTAVNHDRKKMINMGASIIGIVILASSIFAYTIYQDKLEIQKNNTQAALDNASNNKAQQQAIDNITNNAQLNAENIQTQFGNSTVLIEMSWKLIYTPTGKQVFQKFGCATDAKGKCVSEKMPWYVLIDGVVEPFLDFENGISIGASGSGSGFVITEGGHILTNRHVAAPWEMTQSTDFKLPGILMVCNDSACSAPTLKPMANDASSNEYLASLKKWIPTKAKMLGQTPLRGKLVEGRYDYLDVTFKGTSLRLPAHAGPISGNADVALIKIEPTKKLQPVEMGFDDPVSAGAPVTVIGYPGISPDNARQNQSGTWLTIPDVTVTPGAIGKVITSSEAANSYSELNDAYQLTVTATGSGNSGGPVFNDKGHVIGIFTAIKKDANGTMVSFAVPIKHAKEFM